MLLSDYLHPTLISSTPCPCIESTFFLTLDFWLLPHVHERIHQCLIGIQQNRHLCPPRGVAQTLSPKLWGQKQVTFPTLAA